MTERQFTDNEKIEIERLMDQIVAITGPNLDWEQPPALHTGLKRFSQTYCVDGIPVIRGEPSVILVWRDSESVLPNQWWCIGGRVPKGQFDETATLKDRFMSELGIDVKITEGDYIGRGRLIIPARTQDNAREYCINTPTMLYTVSIPDEIVRSGELSAGGGNVRWRLFSARQIVEDESLRLNSYIRLGSAVAIDRVHGTDWRKNLTTDLRNIGYPGTSERLERLPFIPLRIQRVPP